MEGAQYQYGGEEDSPLREHAAWLELRLPSLVLAPDGTALGANQALDEYHPGDDDLGYPSPLARLVRRGEFMTLAERALRRSRWSDANVAVVAVSLDGAADARDDVGWPGGGAALAAAAERILGAVGPAGATTLVGRDEFVVLCDDLRSPGDAGMAASRIHDAMTRPLEVGEVAVSVAVSTGLAVASSPAEAADALIGRACLAMRAARLDQPARSAAPSFFPADLDAGTAAVLDLAGMVVHRLFGAGLALQSVADMADGPVADRLRQVADEVDAIIRDLRTTVFKLQQPGHPRE